MQIDADFPSGRILVRDVSDPHKAILAVPPDEGTKFLCWYAFRAKGPSHVLRHFVIENASRSLDLRLANREAQAHQWQGGPSGGPVASYDGKTWFRLDHSFDGKAYHFWHMPLAQTVYYAKFAPFWPEQEAALMAGFASLKGMRRDVVATSSQGREIPRFQIGLGALNFWITARQHPSETQGAYLLEGLLERLAMPCPDTRALLDLVTLHIVPNVNPDGWAIGQTRATPAGANLNREWNSDTPAPEVAGLRAAMLATGVDLFLDAHADNELAHLFIWPSQNVPSWTNDRQAPFDLFAAAWAKANSDMIRGRPYPGGCPPAADLSMAWNWVGEAFPDALSILLEQTFKDVEERPDPIHGWSPDRARALGRSLIAPLLCEARRRLSL